MEFLARERSWSTNPVGLRWYQQQILLLFADEADNWMCRRNQCAKTEPAQVVLAVVRNCRFEAAKSSEQSSAAV